jgi:hypothetical protein
MTDDFNPTKPLNLRQEDVTPELKDILIINQSIINNLKVQKARLDMSYDKYRNSIESEAKRPSNRFLDWTKILVPYQEMIMNSKVTDLELIKAYDGFVNQLIKHDKNFVIRRDELESKDEVIAELINKTIVGLETELIRTKRELESLRRVSKPNFVAEPGIKDENKVAEAPPGARCRMCGNPKPDNDGYVSCQACRERLRAQRRSNKNERETTKPEPTNSPGNV